MADEAEAPPLSFERPPPQDPVERPPPQDAPWKWPARTQPETPGAVTMSPRDPVLNWANWRLGQVPANPEWNPLTEPLPEAAKESVAGGGPFQPGAFAGVLRKPLTQTQVKYRHPETGDEPTMVFHGTLPDRPFKQFSMRYADEGALYGPGIYFTENPKIASGYAKGEPATASFKTFPTREKADAFAQTKEGAKVRAGWTPSWATREGIEWQVEWPVPKESGPQVRPAFLDIRKPFDADNDVIQPLNLLPLVERRIQAYGTTSDVSGELVAKRLRDRITRAGEPVMWEELSQWVGGGEANRMLRALGYDGITHMGGGRTGNAPHRVWIVFDPKQIINPFKYKSQPVPITPPKPEPTPATQMGRFEITRGYE